MANEKDEPNEGMEERFPDLPPPPDVPEPPKVQVTLPPRQTQTPHKTEPGAYNKMALAFTAASSFIMPVLVLSLGGFWLDKRFGTNWIAFIGVLVGLGAGIVSLLRIIEKLNE